MKNFIIFLLLITALGAGWFLRGRVGSASEASTTAGERKVLFYQSAMHPWIDRIGAGGPQETPTCERGREGKPARTCARDADRSWSASLYGSRA